VDRETRNGTIRVLDPEAVARSRLRIDARKWMAGKMRPKAYGEPETPARALTADSVFIQLVKAITPNPRAKIIEGEAA